jgi:hypothetical protein
MKPLIAITATALLASGCALDAVMPAQKPRSPSYRHGWDDGCESGLYLRNVRFAGRPLAADRYARDEDLFRTDSEYALGWNDGETSCEVGRPGRRRPKLLSPSSRTRISSGAPVNRSASRP